MLLLFFFSIRFAYKSKPVTNAIPVVLICSIFSFLIEVVLKSKSYTSDNVFLSFVFIIPFVMIAMRRHSIKQVERDDGK